MAMQIHCSAFEDALSDFQDGALPPETATAMREHLRVCRHCAELSALVRVARAGLTELTPVTPPPEWLPAVLARTSGQRRWISWREVSRSLGRGVWQPRLAMAFGVVLFAFALSLNLAGINLRRVRWQSLTPGHLVAGLHATLRRGMARGARYYDDLKLVYDIQAALRESPARRSHPPSTRQRNQSDWPGGGDLQWSWNAPPTQPPAGRL